METKMTPPSTLRTDRALLRAPRMLPDGTLRVEAVSATVGEVLTYPWGKEVVTAESLSDPAYLDALRGVGITRHHVRTNGGRLTKDDKSNRVGTVIGARFDEETGQAIRELSIFDPDVAQEVLNKTLAFVSETYDLGGKRDRTDGMTDQTQRLPNSIALTDNPRAKSAAIRTDEANMTPEEIKAKIDEAVGPLVAKLDELTGKLEAAKPEPEEVHTDSADDIAARIVATRLRADSLSVEIPDTVKGEAALLKHVATALGADKARCDAADYCQGFIDACKPEAKKESGWTPTRTDSSDTTFAC